MKRNRKAKILATLGPVSSSKETIERIFKAGCDVFRLNFSHGSVETHRQNLEWIRQLEEKYNHATCILADLQGPKLRVGEFKNIEESLKKGQKFILDTNSKLGDNERVNFPHSEIYDHLTPNTSLLINDGRIRLQIIEQNKDSLITEVLNDGVISNNKGVNIPDVILPIDSLTSKDKADLQKALDMNVDWVALSFVQQAEDIHKLKKIVDGKALVMAKIEKPSAVKNIDDIIQAADGIMIARGDLGVEMPTEKARKVAAKSVGKVLGNNIKLFSTITNTLAKDKSINDEWRKLPSPVTSRNLSNVVEDNVVDSLVSSVVESYPRLSHRYYALKAKWFKKKHLMYWDRNAPLPFQNTKTYSWSEARNTVIEAYSAFDKEIGKIVKKFFDENWIHAPVLEGKSPGAFAASTVASVHPFILVNFQGKTRDVATLAHELGHGVHQYLAGKNQSHFNASTPLTLAETASVFGEMLTFKLMLNTSTSKKERKALIANKVEDMLNTVIRQIAFFQFEKEIHTLRKNSELSTSEICEIWMKVQKDSLGPSIKYEDEYKYFWSYIPHFIHSPFYVYAYAFGDCLVNSLFNTYEQGLENFEDKYIDLLKSGGSKKYDELFQPFNLDLSKKSFWKKGLSMIEKLIDELETL